MADDITDVYIATEAGDAGWQSLSALAAEQVDCELPISSADDTVTLDGASSVFTVSTGSEERVTVKPASYGSGAVTIGHDHVHSIGGISIKNDPDQVNYAAQMQMRFVDEKGKYAYIGCTEPRFAVGANVALVDGGAFFAGHDNGKTVIFSGTEDVIVATGGLANNSERIRVSSTDATFSVPVRTATVKGLVDTDASIFMRTSASIWADYSTPLSVNSYKNQSRISFVNSVSNGWDIGSNENLFTIKDATAVRLTISDTDIQANEFYTPTQPNSIATKKIVDDKIWVGTTAEYLAIPIRDILPTTLYCLTD